jgi:hypothetical protein
MLVVACEAQQMFPLTMVLCHYREPSRPQVLVLGHAFSLLEVLSPLQAQC